MDFGLISAVSFGITIVFIALVYMFMGGAQPE